MMPAKLEFIDLEIEEIVLSNALKKNEFNYHAKYHKE